MTRRAWVGVTLLVLATLLTGCVATIDVGSVDRSRLKDIQAVKVVAPSTPVPTIGELVRDVVQLVLMRQGVRVLGEPEAADGPNDATVEMALTKDLGSYSMSATILHGRTREPLAVVSLTQRFGIFYEPSLTELSTSVGTALAELLTGRGVTPPPGKTEVSEPPSRDPT